MYEYCNSCPIPKCFPRPCCSCPGKYLCCRPPWDISHSQVSRSVNFCVSPLACRSQRYNCWLYNFASKTDSNFCPSLYSSKVENAGYNMVAVEPPVEYGYASQSCPCHF